MDTTITLELVFKAAAFFAVLGGVYWRWQNAISKVNDDLQAHKLHVAQTYASKDGVYKQFESVAKTINEVGKRMEDRLDGMNVRLDRVIEAHNKE